ncbi:hypothetical protein A6F68_00920 [Tsuneonella dongtanensis]|uniref:5-bromo-4-chloroindolyl phosphate hydrolysis protein n=1 Tax=Tsuneonella dongtanensis TaxID=692370 RepID=A0A1B2ABC1_9SPHN|nr:hypothetical protein [Tsuneonella dongtanensis]ANY19446.1 hypothetical protein A6F68_00920 [Tsuneonella dongtanensis]
MGDLTRQSDRIIGDARSVRDDNRAGGRHRRVAPIGQGSARLRAKHAKTKLVQIVIGIVGILVAAGVAGAILNGIGFWGIMIVALTMFLLFGGVVSRKIKVPQRAEINKGNVQQMVAKTELWLEHQRPALPPPAAAIVSDMGVQLDALGLQLEGIDQNHPKAQEIRSLVGEQLPGMVDSYRRIPAHMRTEERGGATPDQQLTDSLKKISGEIDSITRQLAEGNLDDLAIKSRYLDYKYGGEDVALPAPDRSKDIA